MNNPIPIQLAVEDQLSEGVLRKLLSESQPDYVVGTCYSQHGFGYLRKSIRGFNNGSRGTPFLVLTDLDRAECAPTLIREWLGVPQHNNLLFRVAVREVEAWLLGDSVAFARFIAVRENLVPQDVDNLENPKRTLIELTRGSRRRELRTDIVPKVGSTSTQGPNYNGRLLSFVENYWRPTVARQNSVSLHKAMDALDNFSPIWGG